MSRLFVVYSIEIEVLFTPCLVCFMILLKPQFNDVAFVSGFAHCYNSSRSHWPFCHLLDSIFWHQLRVRGLYSHTVQGSRLSRPYDFLTWILSVNKWLQYGNSVCNPVIYGFRNKDFRRAFRKILLGLCCKKVRLSDYSKSAYGRTVRSGRWSAINER